LLNYRVVLLYDLTEFNPIYNGTAGSNPSDSGGVFPKKSKIILFIVFELRGEYKLRFTPKSCTAPTTNKKTGPSRGRFF
jgi:hypothetical protein